MFYFLADISIKEYADADKSNGRIRKGAGNAIKHETVNDEIEVLDEDEMTTVKKSSRAKKLSESPSEDDHNYNFFPNDIWFLISEYIRPEDVTRFALICKQTYIITTTLKFWRNLYRRYYKPTVELPVRLQLDCMTRPRGTRPCAIRSLFFTYPLFVNRIRSQSLQDFHSLNKLRVVQFWFERVNTGKFLYFYKLKHKLHPGSRTYESEQLQRRDGKSIKALRDVYCNTEEGCRLLVVRRNSFFI